LNNFDKKGEKLIKSIQDKEFYFKNKVDYFSSILDKVDELKKNAEEPEEEIF